MRLFPARSSVIVLCTVIAVVLCERVLLPYWVESDTQQHLLAIRNELKQLPTLVDTDNASVQQYATMLNHRAYMQTHFVLQPSSEALGSAADTLRLASPHIGSTRLVAVIQSAELQHIFRGQRREQYLSYLVAVLFGGLIGAYYRRRAQRVSLNAASETIESDFETMARCHEMAQLGCWEWQADTKQFRCSPTVSVMMEHTQRGTMDEKDFFHNLYSSDRVKVFKAAKKLLNKKTGGHIDFRISTSSGAYRHIHLISQVQRNDQHQVVKVIGTCQDMTARKMAEARLHQLSSAMIQSGSRIMIINILGEVEYINPKYSELTGFTLEELAGQQPALLSRTWLSNERYAALWNTLLNGQNWRGELQDCHKDGELFWSLASISPVYSEYQELTHFVVVCEDVTELKNAHARMQRLALYDELTELPNRRLFFQELAALFKTATQDITAVVMLLDLDFFKAVNDTQGHSTGDQLLIEVAERLVGCIDENDMAARLGGDEFAILIRNPKSLEPVEMIAKTILDTISQPYYINNFDIQISTSLGLACLPKDASTPESILKYADLAMYEAKDKGRNQYRFFTASLHQKLQTYVQFSRDMPHALAAGEFELLYQPQVDLRTGKVVSVEALLRWNHPHRGVVTPDHFISVAEETGFIVALGRWVLTQACLTLQAIALAGYGHVRVAVNLSSRQFRDPQLLKMVKTILSDCVIDPRCLELEITESLLMQDIDVAIETLQYLQKLGVTIAIDDFGIGYSSFSYLKTLPVDVLKVDREFIKDIPEHLEDMEITAAIISMAHRLNMRVVAEGIETMLQQRFLAEHGCDIGQGYLFSKPLTSDALLSFLKDENQST